MPNVDGIVSGIDTTALINSIIAAQKVSVDTMKSRVKEYESQKEAVAGVKSRLTTLSDSIKKIDTIEKFQSFTVASTAEQYALTASSGAVPGVYDVQVLNLATAQNTASQGFDDKTTATLATGTLSVTVGTETYDITIDGTNNTLAKLADALDDIDGLSSYVIDTGVTTGRYKLMVQGSVTGAAGAFTLDTSGLSGGLVPTFTNNSSAVDAEVLIGGVSVHVASNTLDGAIPGIRIELKKPGTAAESATVSEDFAAMRAKLQETIDAYNAVVDYHGSQSVYNTDAGLHGPLVGESSTRRALEDLGSMFSSPYTVTGSTISSLSQLGVSTGRDGKLELDTEAFDEMMGKDSAVVEAFLTSTDGPLAKIADRIDTLYVDSDNGTLVSRQEGIDSTIDDLNDRIERSEARLDSQAKRLRDQFTAMETILGQIQSSQTFLSSFFASMSTSTSSG